MGLVKSSVTRIVCEIINISDLTYKKKFHFQCTSVAKTKNPKYEKVSKTISFMNFIFETLFILLRKKNGFQNVQAFFFK